MPGRARKEIVDPKESGIYHCTSRCVRQSFLLESVAADSKEFTCTPDGEGEWVEFRGPKGVRYRVYRRRGWLAERLRILAAIMAIDVITYTVMGNHLHVVIRNRPEVAAKWDDREVAWRWKSLNSKQFELREVTEEEIDEYVKDKKKIEQWRSNLSSISWFMRMLKEPVSIAANRMDKKKGHFWEARFRSQRLLDEAALLACMVYVDLNPIRALLAMKPEDSTFTSIADRIRDFEEKLRLAAAAFQQPDAGVPVAAVPVAAGASVPDAPGHASDAGVSSPSPVVAEFAGTAEANPGHVPPISDCLTSSSGPASSSGGPPVGDARQAVEGSSRQSGPAREEHRTPSSPLTPATPLSRAKVAAYTAPRSGWLNPIDERGDGYAGVAAGRRASDRGTLPISLETYMQIVDWTGRQLRDGKRGAIPDDLAPILDRIGLRKESWLETVTNFGKWFGHMVGKPAAMAAKAAQAGIRSWGGMRFCRQAFT